MKILHTISSANPAGGGPIEGIRQIAQVLVSRGHSVEVLTGDTPDADFLKAFPIPVHATGPAIGSYGYAPKMLGWLRTNHSNYDVVILNGLWQYNGLATWSALRKSNTPYFAFTHGMLDPWFKRTYPLKHIKKMFFWHYAQYKILRDARAVCFTADEERLLARQSFKPYNVKEQIVGYGTTAPIGDPEVQRAAFRERCPETVGKNVYLFLSRIHEKKGCDILIKSFAAVASLDPQAHLVIAGPDKSGLTPKLTALAQSIGIADRISWPGMLAGDPKWGAFRSAEAFVLSSHQENFGIAVAEALACGCPVLISNKINIWREIEADGAGIVANDDVESTTKMLRTWIELPQSKKDQMRAAALETFNNRYELNKVAAEFIEMLQNAVAEKQPY